MMRFHVPEHPTWRMFLALFVMFFVALVLSVVNQRGLAHELKVLSANQSAARERGYINRAVGCMDIINDGEITLTAECVDPLVAAYYPAGICLLLPERVPGCGSKAYEI